LEVSGEAELAPTWPLEAPSTENPPDHYIHRRSRCVAGRPRNKNGDLIRIESHPKVLFIILNVIEDRKELTMAAPQPFEREMTNREFFIHRWEQEYPA
jgi:hypothetical protein